MKELTSYAIEGHILWMPCVVSMTDNVKAKFPQCSLLIIDAAVCESG